MSFFVGKFQFFFLYFEIRLVCFRNENASRKLVVDEIFSNHPPSGVLLIGEMGFIVGGSPTPQVLDTVLDLWVALKDF